MPDGINHEGPMTATQQPAIAGLTRGDEMDLVAQAKSGSEDAIAFLVGCYQGRVLHMARNITGNHEDAEDVVQNALTKAFENLATFRGDSRFYTWLVRIVLNEALMKVRRRRFREVSIDDAGDDQENPMFRRLEDWGPNPEERYSQEELWNILSASISELEPEHRMIIQLRDLEGFSTQETARALDLSLSAVKSRLRRARVQLRDSLETYLRPPNSNADHGGITERYLEAVQ